MSFDPEDLKKRLDALEKKVAVLQMPYGTQFYRWTHHQIMGTQKKFRLYWPKNDFESALNRLDNLPLPSSKAYESGSWTSRYNVLCNQHDANSSYKRTIVQAGLCGGLALLSLILKAPPQAAIMGTTCAAMVYCANEQFVHVREI
jgi:hypothetical protein